jgi:hypothetical protein
MTLESGFTVEYINLYNKYGSVSQKSAGSWKNKINT